MGLLSFLKSAAATPSAKPVAKTVVDGADDVQVLRLRARRRLIGAAVLVALGVIGFPLVFETQPRPIPVDLPIDIPRKESAAPLVIPAPVVPAPAPAVTAVVEPTPEPVVEAAAPVPLPAPSAPVKIAVEKPKEKPAQPSAPRPDAARVQALLDGRPAEAKASEAAAAAGRFIVQVGAYADTKAAQEVRLKVEKLGLKTYVQAVDTADGRRIRVRVGPFATREEAGKVAAKVASGGGLKTVVLTL